MIRKHAQNRSNQGKRIFYNIDVLNYSSISKDKEKELMKEHAFRDFYKLKKDKKELLCFGVKHTKNKEDLQFITIKHLIEQFKPDCVVFEIPENALFYLKLESLFNKTELINKFGEIGEIYRFLNKSVKIEAGDLEFSNAFSLLYDKNTKYDKEDIFITLLLIETQNYSINKMVLPKTIIDRRLIFFEKEDKERILDKINIYLKNILKKELKDVQIEDRFSPTPIDNNSIFHDIYRDMTYFRDFKMLRTIVKCLNKYDKVLFFAGKNHTIRQESYLRERFNE